MYGIGMLYEIGKQRMQEFAEDAERRRLLKPHDMRSCEFSMEAPKWTSPSEVGRC